MVMKTNRPKNIYLSSILGLLWTSSEEVIGDPTESILIKYTFDI